MGSGYKDLFRFGVTDLRFRVEGFGSTMRKMSFSLARGDQGENNCLFGGTRRRQWLPDAFASKDVHSGLKDNDTRNSQLKP